MNLVFVGLSTAVAVACVAATVSLADEPKQVSAPSPIYGVTLPQGYRQWPLIAPAEEAEPLNELRAVLGNAKAVDAYQNKQLPFPDGTVLVKLAWKRLQSPEFAPASVPGAPTTVQVMVKDSRKYGASAASSMGCRPTKRSTRPASPAMMQAS